METEIEIEEGFIEDLDKKILDNNNKTLKLKKEKDLRSILAIGGKEEKQLENILEILEDYVQEDTLNVGSFSDFEFMEGEEVYKYSISAYVDFPKNIEIYLNKNKIDYSVLKGTYLTVIIS